MLTYRLYKLKNGKIFSGLNLVAADDSEALIKAFSQARGGDCELWQASRFVATIKANGEPIIHSPSSLAARAAAPPEE